jgi:hypothetical protein
MASEMRRLAMLLVERRSETFASRHPREESRRRVESALQGLVPKAMAYDTRWRDEGGATFLDVTFLPARGTRRLLNSVSIALVLLLAAAVWALAAPGELAGGRVLVMIATLLAILGFPFLVVAFGSHRDAEEANLRRRIRRAIVEEDDGR